MVAKVAIVAKFACRPDIDPKHFDKLKCRPEKLGTTYNSATNPNFCRDDLILNFIMLRCVRIVVFCERSQKM